MGNGDEGAVNEGVLIVRDDGVVDVPGAIPWPAQLADQIERTLAAVLGPRDDAEPRMEPE